MAQDQHDTREQSEPTNEYAVTRAPNLPQDAPPNARYASSDEFLKLAGKIVTEEVYLLAIDRTVIVKALNPAEVAKARNDIVETKGGRQVPRLDRDFGAMVAYYATINPDGSRYFRRDQIDMLNTQTNYSSIQPLYRAALRLSGLDEEAEELARKKRSEGGGKDD